MKKKKADKSNAQLIIGALLSGKSLRSREISEMVLEDSGKEIKVQDVASMLSKLSDSQKCDLGFFIERKKIGTGFVYNMVKEALKLSEKQAYNLSLKTGKDRYKLEQALKDFPGLKKYTKPSTPKSKPSPAKTVAKKAPKSVKPSKPVKAKPSPAKAKKETKIPPVILSDEKVIEEAAAKIIQKIADLEGLNMNVTVSFKLED